MQEAIASGRIHRPEDAAQEAFSLWVERERNFIHRKFGSRPFDQAQAEAAATRLLQRRERHPLPDGVTIRELLDAGRH